MKIRLGARIKKNIALTLTLSFLISGCSAFDGVYAKDASDNADNATKNLMDYSFEDYNKSDVSTALIADAPLSYKEFDFIEELSEPEADADIYASYRPLAEDYKEIPGVLETDSDLQNIEEMETSYRTPSECLPPIRSQYPTGTCWAHSAMAMAEISMAKKGQVNPSEIDLSEMELAYFSYNSVTDPLGGTVGDSNKGIYSASYPNCYQIGGNLGFAECMLASWNGAGDEKAHRTSVKDIPYAKSNEKKDDILGVLKDSYAYDDVAHLTDAYHADIINDREGVKKLIKEYGAVSTSYYSNDSYYDKTNFSYYCPYSRTTNHAITIVGWDDSFSKDKFKMGSPEGNGAWLIRNSWGSNKEYDYMSYFWMSYYDKSLANVVYCYSFNTVAKNYDNNYQYDGGVKHLTYTVPKGTMTSNVFTAKANNGGVETLGAVGLYAASPNIDVKIEVYTNLSDIDNPESGTLISGATVEKNIQYEGYHTINLNSGVKLNAGDTFSIVVTHLSDGEINKFVAEMSQVASWYKLTTFADAHQSFYRYSSDKKWTDYGNIMGNSGNICIKAFTVNGDKLRDGREVDEGGETPVGNVTSVTVDPDKVSIDMDEKNTSQLSAKVLPDTAENKQIVWSSSDEKIASVDDSGMITAISPGTVTIYAASAQNPTIKGSCEVTVTSSKEEPDEDKNDTDDDSSEDIGYDDGKLRIQGLKKIYEYTGMPVIPEFSLSIAINGKREYLSKGTDYTVKFINNKEQGSLVTMIITGKGRFKGTKSYPGIFKIDKIKPSESGAASIKSLYTVGGIDKAGYTYNGEEIRPAIYLINKTTGEIDTGLKENVDYMITMSNNVAAGKASVLISGIGRYCDSIKTSFKINKLNLSSESRNVTVKVSDTAILNLKGASPKLEASIQLMQSDGSLRSYVLQEGRDIKIQFANNKMITSWGSYILTGKGNFTGKITSSSYLAAGSNVNFKITSPTIPENPFEANQVIVACFPNIGVGEKILSSKYEMYDMAGNKIKSKVVTDSGDLSGDTKTHIGVIYTYKGKMDATERILNPANPDDKNIVAAPGDEIRVKIFGNAIYSGESEPYLLSVGYEPMQSYAINKAIVSKGTEYAFSGKNILPDKNDIAVLTKDNKFVPKNSYDILCTNNVNKGNAIALIRCKDGYTGYKMTKFKIGAMNLFN